MIKLNLTLQEIVEAAENRLEVAYKNIDDIALRNQLKVLNAFLECGIEPRHFNGTTGYGYDDIGRDVLNKLFARIMGAESAIMSPSLSSGTQALSHALLGLLRPSDTMLSISGMPYDTLKKVLLGEEGKDIGSLKDFGIHFDKLELINNNFDLENIIKKISLTRIKMVYIQRSKGYEFRPAINIDKINEVIKLIKSIDKSIIVMIDNCYGELTEVLEPCDVGADIIAGSLIKNLGAGIAPNGGYIAGRADLVEQISYRMTSPALGGEVGSYEPGYRAFYQGLFLASNAVATAKKGALLCADIFKNMGYDVLPNGNIQSDIVACVKFNNEEKLVEFCRAIQNASPIDGMARLEPWDMPGYENQVIMASGSFQQGSSIELSCDAPIRAPYLAYMQGGLTYAHIKIALIYALDRLSSKGLI